MASRKLAIVAGAGPGLGQALMRKLDEQGCHAVGITRSGKTDSSGLDIRGCDLSDPVETGELLKDLVDGLGAPSLVVHNTANLVRGPFAELKLYDFEQCWTAMVASAISLAHGVLEPMAKAGGGTFIVSGATASLRGGRNFAAFASAKFALRGLTQSLAREYQPKGIHVVHTILDGIIDTLESRELHALDPARMMKVDDLADAYWVLSQQPVSTWSHEIDFRPQSENF